MSVVIVFVLVMMGLAGWWLLQQRVMSKPWLETGTDVPGGYMDDAALPTQKVALIVFLAVVGALFALFGSAYVMRTEYADWRPLPLPQIVWLNTAMLVVGSVALQSAAVASRHADLPTVRIGLITAAVAGTAFTVGQLFAWRELVVTGYLLADNPANSFFFLITGLHGLHILGGLVALGRVMPGAWGGDSSRLRLNVELCATYWHFLLIVWLGILVLLIGWVNEFIALCRQLLS